MFDTEAEIQQLIQMEAIKYECHLMRNNSGALKDHEGRLVRYGLDNTSAKRNEVIKSSDLIGFTIYRGLTHVAPIFTAIEVKKRDWKYSGDKREIAQLAFINWVIKHGGYAGFANSIESFRKIIGK